MSDKAKIRGTCKACGSDFCAACGGHHEADAPKYDGLCGEIRWREDDPPERQVCMECLVGLVCP